MHFDRGDALALLPFLGGVALVVFYIIPRIEFAIAAFELVTGGY